MVEQNKKVMERFVDFINTADIEIGKEVLSDEAIFYAPVSPEPLRGYEGYMTIINMMRSGLPDVQWKAEEMIAEGANVVVRYTMTATHTKDFMGIPATNKQISITCLNIYRFKDGKIVGEVGMPDLFGLLGQIGAFNR
jgi:steroid delta-isomerase-like uncharacterized protein